jgi:hypothetical protein
LVIKPVQYLRSILRREAGATIDDDGLERRSADQEIAERATDDRVKQRVSSVQLADRTQFLYGLGGNSAGEFGDSFPPGRLFLEFDIGPDGVGRAIFVRHTHNNQV